jgi:hypothetical protein
LEILGCPLLGVVASDGSTTIISADKRSKQDQNKDACDRPDCDASPTLHFRI